MAKRHYHLDTRILAVFFLVGIPFVVFGSFLVVSMARSNLQDSIGESLEQRALQTKVLLERYIGDQIVHLRLLSLDPQVRTAVVGRAPSDADRRALEQSWSAGKGDGRVRAVVDSPLARRLREVQAVRPALRLLQVVDASGHLVASTARAGRVSSADMPWFADLTGRDAYVGDLQAGPGREPTLDIAYPIWDDTEYRMLGAVRTLVDAADLYGVLAPVRIGRTGHALLVRAKDGLILASDESDKALTQRFPGFASLQAAIRERRGHWIVPELEEAGAGGEVRTEPRRLIGYSSVEQVPGDSRWIVVVEQDLSEATAPIGSVTWYLWLHFLGAFTTVILLALYFSFKLETPVIEEELHLHEEHVPSGMQRAT